MSKKVIGWAALLGANLFIWGVLSFYGSSTAAPQGAKQPFSNAVEQRHDIIRELQKISTLLQEQNQLLRAMDKQPRKKL
jgi:uncharacterized membrane protein YvbJ